MQPWQQPSQASGHFPCEKQSLLLRLPHLRGHHCDLLRGDGPTQHVLFQLRVFGVLQVGDAAPHTVFVFHVGVLDILVDA